MAQDTATVEDRSTYKANAVHENLVTDGEDVWVENDEDNRIDADDLAVALDRIEGGDDEVSFADVTVFYAERHEEDRDGWRGEHSPKGIPLHIEFQNRSRETNMTTIRGLLAQDTSVDGVECLEVRKKLINSSANLVTDGTALWYDGYDSEKDRVTLEQARGTIEAIEAGAEEVFFENAVSIEKQCVGIDFHYSTGTRAVQTNCLKEFVENNI